MNKHTFYSNCVGWPSSDLESLDEMIEKEQEIDYKEMIEEVSLDQLHELFPFYVDCPLTIEKDWSVRFFRSTLHGKPCVFVRHSAIEYAFKRTEDINCNF